MTPETIGSVSDVAKILDAATTIGVVGHVGPDGDALGAMIGLALAARGAGKTVYASFDVPFVVPDEMAYLDTSTLVAPTDFPKDLDVAVAVDTSVSSRVGALAPRMESADTLAIVDHHLSDGSWGDVVLVDPTAAATTELIYAIIEELGWTITPDVATALYTGIVTDTGRFQYSNTTPRTHEITARLIEHGVAPAAVSQKLYEEAPFGYFELVSRVLGRAVLDEDHRFVWSQVTPDDLEASGLELHDIDGLIDLVRLARESDVACLLKVKENGTIKGSLRSRGRVNVAAIAASFGGGGHHNAAGFTSHDDVETIVESVVAQLP